MDTGVDSKGGITNAFSVDVEDYFHVEALASTVDRASWGRMEYRAEDSTRRLLDLLAAHHVRATFFLLGWIARRSPQLVRAIHGAGHEVACHGLNHQMVNQQSPEQFRRETIESKSLLENAIGVSVRGYRAATYSITRESLWALEILAELGFVYDSSINPIRHDLYGIPDAPRFPYRPAGAGLLEVPITTVELLGRRIPCGGGGYFRLLPYALFSGALRRVNRTDGQPVVFYCHPWEVDPAQPRVAGLSWKSRFRHYTNLSRMESRLTRLLRDFRWARMDEVFVGV
jgi:polysaccharide deacetylase family protein (PEP-CTERM system associated)